MAMSWGEDRTPRVRLWSQFSLSGTIYPLNQKIPLQISVMNYSVWLFTKPLRAADSFPLFALTSDGKAYLCHWGVLISEMSVIDARAILLRTTEYGAKEAQDFIYDDPA
jgi:hypothetical protein